MIKIRNRNTGILLIDFVMMGLLLVNLLLIIFDWIFLADAIKQFFFTHAKSFFHFYNQKVHQNFVVIDLVFVGIFLLEFFIRWIIAVTRQSYYRWFFYPFIHWYDVIGCIPIASFRFLRVLRIISIFYRLQRLSVIDLKQTYLYIFFKRYFDILVEEVSDRVVVNVLNGFQDELKKDTPLTEKILKDVVAPKKDILTAWLVQRIRSAASGTYLIHKDEIQRYLSELVGEAIKGSKEVKAIVQVPVVGGFIGKTLQKAIADITITTLDNAIEDMSGEQHNALFSKITENMVEGFMSKEEQVNLSLAIKEVILESLDLIKAQVEVQQWKVKEEKARAASKMS